ncbi:deoxyribonuclease-1-like isoform X2 [Mercenaria mercenaria]|uniref:deoxyribonuclease-1-like isoform X2 n=1 Tax=Mercenaria mercenaria TaxID=6596 RepID=UPI00234EE87A|nr:deoxyribonuclease-1-like isoform X2 [Mercenaria mercenaria]
MIKLVAIVLCVLYIHVNCLVFDQVDGSDTLPTLAEPPLRIGSFNIQVFGSTKVAKSDVLDVLVKILSRYDIVQILEIRDSTNTAFEKLRVALNNYVAGADGTVYEKIVSDRLGRTTSKEQYGFLYRSSKVSVADTYQFHDTHDYFEREPFSVKFKSPKTTVQDFVMVANHIQPKSAAEEMDNLTKVYDTLRRHWGIEDVLLGGDFNADCNYMSLSAWKNISLRTDGRFEWLVDDDTDTTVSHSACSYDRFVVAGDKLLDAVVPGSVQAYRFDELMGLTKDKGLRVSDHYPIELQLKGKPHMATQQAIHTSISFTVKDTKPVNSISNIRYIYRTPSCADKHLSIKVQREDTHMDFVQAHFTTADSTQVMVELKSFRSSCTGTLSAELLSMVQSYMQSHFLRDTKPDVYGLMYSIKKNVYDVTIKCSLLIPYVCEVTVSKNIS